MAVQFTQESHSQIKRINNSALNTTRIVTILNGTEPVYLIGFQSFATNDEKLGMDAVQCIDGGLFKRIENHFYKIYTLEL